VQWLTHHLPGWDERSLPLMEDFGMRVCRHIRQKTNVEALCPLQTRTMLLGRTAQTHNAYLRL
jgi:hypothetical protein